MKNIKLIPGASFDIEGPVIRDYNQEDYREFWTGPSKLFAHRIECRILREIIPPTSGWFIDVGSGYGRLLPTYLRSDRKIILLDYAVNLLEIASQTNPYENVYYIAANAYHMPFRDGVFSAGLSVRTFHHMNAPQHFLDEFARIFHKGSSVVIGYSNKRNLLRIFNHGFRCFHHDHERYGEMLFGTHPAYFAELGCNAGFSVKSTRGTEFVDQIATSFRFLDRLLEKMPFLIFPLAIAENIADYTFGRMGLAPLNFALLRKAAGTEGFSEFGQHCNLEDILACPRCRNTNIKEQDKGFSCVDCRIMFAKKGRIFDFRYDGR